jgi:hypothetical protein
MSSSENMTGKTEDQALEQALRDFRSSVCAWSDAVYSEVRPVAAVAPRGSWRLAVGWALGCILAAGSVAGGVYVQRHHRQDVARIGAAAPVSAQAAKQQQPAAAPRVREEDEDLLAKVDSDVSRQVPNAMEPLAQLMTEDETE